ncbi:putative MICOS complex subunit mic60 [Phaeomoniella chlamydospora]|uniref:MICOS complex subunit MIC60 n=1 Tax=Phaeomoniella chlamydospora TaxID=158046 RepID=A0A0G2E929_PHACM|nr:putative MICOS complex subunit mic60 [Phaeomoniella chlamydospora]
MERRSSSATKPFGSGEHAQQSHRLNDRSLTTLKQRNFADPAKPDSSSKESISSSDPVFLPGSLSPAAKPEVPPPAGKPTPASPSSDSTIPVENVPKVPPVPAPKVQTAPPTNVPPPSPATSESSPPPPPPPPKKKKRRGLRFLTYLLFTGGLVYGGGVWYALRSDNFHDFFTEFIPFGEEVVLYFEERSFSQRFPHAQHHARKLDARPRDESKAVTIPSRSGQSWRVKDEEGLGADVSQKGPHMSALGTGKTEQKNAQKQPSQATEPEKTKAVEQAKAATGSTTPSTEKSLRPATKEAPAAASPAPKTNERSPVVAPVAQISPLSVASAEEPIVQELVKTVNDLITVINADNGAAANKYSQPIEKAKESLSSVGAKIVALKKAAEEDAKSKIEEAHKEFEERARNLISQIDVARAEETAAFREQFEQAREQLAQAYHEKVKLEVQRSAELAEAKLKNELMDQAIELKRKFSSEIHNLVEKERDGRLSKLSDLSSNVTKLQELTSNWNGVIDTNLSTQKLQVAVDAVRSTLERASLVEGRPRPFVRELAALKEVANGDPVVDAAIASINPLAYQRGLPSSHQLVDRFRRVASEVRKAALLPEDAGVASHAASFLISKVMFKKEGLAEGNDVESILTRTETLLEEGNLDAAAREMNGLQGWAKTLSKDWLGEVRRVLEVQQAMEVSYQH